MASKVRYLLLTVLAALPSLVHAQETKPANEGSVSLGYVGTNGNTESQTLESGVRYIMRRSNWTHNLEFQSLYAKQEDEVNGERFFLQGKSDYEISEDDYAFVKASYTDDRFTGFDYQATTSLGYGHYFYNRDDLSLEAYTGVGYRYSKIPEVEIAELESSDLETQGEAILTVGENFKYQLTETTRLTQSLTSEIGEDLTVSRFEIGLVSTLIGALATKIAFEARHISEVPPDRENTDTQTSVNLVYEF